MSNQYSMFDDCFVDSFAGGGGASTGIELATGRPVDVAINHNEAAIMMHRQNHPFTEHYIEDIWQVDPKTAVRGRHVRLAWFSPDCKHFSRAKGAALVDKKIRGLAWVVLKWAAEVRPDIIMLENVPEFTTWGPVRKGKPVKSKEGQNYQKWLRQLQDLGYEVETNKLCAADYGAPTIRTRFHLIARCDGNPIVWPKRTHAPRGSIEVRCGKLKPWKSAAEVIDFSLPCPSIFASKAEIKEQYGINAKRPLKENTIRRIAKGLDKFVIRSAEPFIVECNHDGEGHVQPIKKPLNTITAKYSGGIVYPFMTPYHMHNHSNASGTAMNDPINTVTCVGAQMLISPLVTPYIMCNNTGNIPHEMGEPVPTITTGGRNFVTAPRLIQYHTEQNSKEVRGQKVDEPIQTVDIANRYGLSHLAHFKGKDKGQHPLDPLMTVTARNGQFADVRATVVKWDGQTDLGYWNEIRKMLNMYCGYNLAKDDILLLKIRGAWYFISDIGLRMLIPSELYAAMGFPVDYIIDKDVNGRPITKEDQVTRCGNAVCPAVAEALVRANLPEQCKKKISDMAHLYNVMTS